MIYEQVNNSDLGHTNYVDNTVTSLNSTLPPIRIDKDKKECLENHFKNEQGLSLSSGVRMIIFQYMKGKNLF